MLARAILIAAFAATPALAGGGGLNASSSSLPTLSSADRAAIVDDLVERLRSNPEILVETLLRFRQAEKEDGALGLAPADAPTTGQAGAQTIVVEFVDYACEPCRAAGLVLDGLAASGEIRVVHRDLPLSVESRELAVSALEAHKGAGRYSELRTELLSGRARPASTSVEGRQFAFASMKRTRADATRLGVKSIPAFAVIREGRMELLEGEITKESVREAAKRLGG